MNALNPNFVFICLLYGIIIIPYLQQCFVKRKHAIPSGPDSLTGIRPEALAAFTAGGNDNREIILHALSYRLETLMKLALLNARESEKNKLFLEKYNELFYGEQRSSYLDWEAVYPLIDLLHNDFAKTLRTRYALLLSEKELQLCCLLRIRLETKDIACVMGQSVHTIRKWKTGIRKKTGLPDGADIPACLLEEISGCTR